MNAARTVRVNLDFTATTSQAEAALSRLNTNLRNISSQTNLDTGGLRLPEQLNTASVAAIKLRENLQNAINVDTGRLDLSKFNHEMEKSGMSLKQYRDALVSLGPTGQAAFMDLSKAILASETPLKQTNVLVDKLWDSLKRTAGWQLSSTAIHAFVGAISTAYNYAQDLNKSLNDIRIVTGYGSDRMAEFAKNANKAAKQLSATTLDYTNASLIYYQQGLDDKAVQERSDVTVKMANVTGTAAQTVSDQLTAIWENFMKDGEHAAEWYADVMTALGAATASSTDEIAEGLEKFAAVADTVGLSYEYATAALTTITAKTRQSADVVGTALKTLFARIEGLNLGETLDDGTTLNKYSKALDAVGVNIKNEAGELKSMDEILDEIGAKWDTIGKDQQIALAQTVAGVRQYTQFIALMDNWDFMQENLETVAKASGTLDEQAQIYAESWEAAKKRVQAAAESIYQDLLKDDFFIGLTDAFGSVLEFIDKIIDSLGGLSGVLPGIALLVNKIFGDKIIAGAQTLAHNLMNLTAAGRAANMKRDVSRYEEVAQLQKGLNPNSGLRENNEAAAVSTTADRVLAIQKQILGVKGKITEEDRKHYQIILESVQASGEELQTRAKQLDLAQEEARLSANEIRSKASFGSYDYLKGTGSSSLRAIMSEYDSGTSINDIALPASRGAQQGVIDQLNSNLGLNGSAALQLDDLTNKTQKFQQALQSLSTASVQSFIKDFDGLGESIRNNAKQLAEFEHEADQLANLKLSVGNWQKDPNFDLEGYKQQFRDLGYSISDAADAEELLTAVDNASAKALQRSRRAAAGNTDQIEQFAEKYKLSTDEVQRFTEQLKKAEKMGLTYEEYLKQTGEAAVLAGKSIENASTKVSKMAVISEIGNGLMSVQMGVSSVASAINTAVTDEDLSGWERFSSILMSLSMGLPMILNGLLEFGALISTKSITEIAGLENLGEDVIQELLSSAGDKSQIEAILKEAGIGDEIIKSIVDQVNKASTGLPGLINKLGSKLSKAGSVIAGFLTNPIALGVAAAVAVVGATVYLAVTERKRQATAAMEAATQSAKEASAAYEELKGKVENLKSSYSEYSSILKTLGNLKSGTAEWTEAVVELNNQVLELLKTYPQLAEYINNSNGILTIDAEGYEKVAKEMATSAAAAQVASIDSQKKILTATINYDIVDKGFDKSLNSDSMLRMADAIQKDAGIIIGALPDESGEIDQAKMDESIAAMADSAKVTKEQAEAVLSNSECLDYLRETVTTTNTKLDTLNSSRIAALTSSMDLTEDQRALANSSELMQGVIKRVIENNYDKIDNKDQTGDTALRQYVPFSWSATAEGEAAFREYLKNQGKTEEEIAAIWKSADFKKDSITWKQTGEDGTTVDKEISYDALVNSINAARETTAAQQSSQDVANALDKITALTNSSNVTESAYGKYLSTGSVDSLTEEEFKALQGVGPQIAAYIITGGKDAAVEITEGMKAVMDTTQVAPPAISKEAQYDSAAHDRYLHTSGQQILSSNAESLDTSVEALEAYTAELLENNTALDGNYEKAAKMAVANVKFANGLNNLNNVLDDEIGNVKNASKKNLDYYKSLGKITQAINDLYDTDVDADFVAENLELIEEAAKGSEKALAELSVAIVKADLNSRKTLNAVDLSSVGDDVQTAANNLNTALASYSSNLDNVNAGLAAMQANMADVSGPTTLANALAGCGIGAETFIASLNSMAIATGQTYAQMEADLAKMGMSMSDFDVTYAEVPTKEDVALTTTKRTVTDLGDGEYIMQDKITNIKHQYIDSIMQVPQIHPKGGSSAGGITVTPPSSGGAGLVSGGKSSGGGGGGGGSGSQKDKKKSSDEIERYHTIKKEIGNLSREYDNLSAAKDRAFGANRLRVMDQETAKLEEQIAAQKRYVDEIDSYYSQDRAAIAAYGAVFDENGIITNYEQIMQEQLDIFNASLTDEAEESYNDFKDILNQYEETLELKLSEADKLVEQEYDKISLQLEKITYSVEIKVQVHDDQIDFLERRLDRLSNSERRQYDSYLVQQEKVLELQQKRLATQQGIDAIQADIAKQEAQGLEMTDEQNEQLRTYRETLADIDDQIFDIKFSIIEDIGIVFDNYFDDLDYYIDRISTLNDMMETIRDTLDLLGYDNLDNFNSINEQLLSNQRVMLKMSQQKLSSATGEVEYWQRLATFVEGINSLDDLRDSSFWANDSVKKIAENAALAEDSIKAVKDAINNQLKEATDRQLETQQEIYESINDIVQAIKDNWVDAVEKVVAVQKKGLLNDIDYAVDRYGDLADLNDLYLSNSKKIYELNKLNRTILQDISKTDNVAAKSKLKDVLEEVNALQNSNAQMSEYELKTLQAKYDLRLAEIALEEAQEAKSQVRLVRDNEGNWGYMYTADAEEVSKAEQDVEDKMQALQDIQEETMRDTGEKILSIQQEYYDALSDIYTDASLTQKERDKREEALRESTMKKLSYYTDQYDKALKQSGMNFKDTILGTMYPEYETLQKFNDNFASSADTTFTMIQDQYKATTKYYQELAQAMGITDESVLNDLGSMKEAIAKAMLMAQQNMQTAIKDSQEKFNATTQNMDKLADTIKEMGKSLRDWVEEMTKLAVVFNSNADYFDLMIKALKNNDMDSAEKYAEYRAMKISLDPNSYGQYSWGSKEAMVKDFQEQGVWISDEKADSLWNRYNNTTQKYDTGGYTGEWGHDGKLAVLHQKELVLNASDTANMLDIVNVVRDIVRQIDAQALYSRGRRFDLPRIETRAETLEQNVHIEANFPNATSHQEIEQAFDNLINLASQYVNKK